MADHSGTRVLAFLRMKLTCQDVVPSDRGTERLAVLGGCHDEILVFGQAVVAVYEVELAVVRDPVKDRVAALLGDLVLLPNLLKLADRD